MHMVHWRMMFGEVVTHVGVSWRATYMEVFLLYYVRDPIEVHINWILMFVVGLWW
jgi:hypothetical protein